MGCGSCPRRVTRLENSPRSSLGRVFRHLRPTAVKYSVLITTSGYFQANMARISYFPVVVDSPLAQSPSILVKLDKIGNMQTCG